MRRRDSNKTRSKTKLFILCYKGRFYENLPEPMKSARTHAFFSAFPCAYKRCSYSGIYFRKTQSENSCQNTRFGTKTNQNKHPVS